MSSVVMMMVFTERQNRKLLEQLEEQKKRLRMQTQQQTAGAATTGLVFVCAQCTLLFNMLFKILCVIIIIQNLMQELICSSIHFWHAPLWVRSAKRRRHSPEWTIVSHVSVFIQGEVQWFQVLLGSLHPRTTGASRWSPPVLQGETVKICLVSSDIRTVWPNGERRHAWTVAERCGCSVFKS